MWAKKRFDKLLGVLAQRTTGHYSTVPVVRTIIRRVGFSMYRTHHARVHILDDSDEIKYSKFVNIGHSEQRLSVVGDGKTIVTEIYQSWIPGGPESRSPKKGKVPGSF
jgi:hypothetical protein